MSEYAGHEKEHILDRVIDIRYTDPKEEKTLCQQLLQWSEEQNDLYGKAFAHTYLADYYISQNDSETALLHLMDAKGLLAAQETCKELQTRAYCLLGVCFGMQSEEQNSIQSYMDALRLAREIEDKVSQCVILNNLAYSFQRHHSYTVAYEYYEDAYRLQEHLPDSGVKIVLLSNLSELSLILNKPEQAKHYLELERLEKFFSEEDEQLNLCGWAGYHAYVGEMEKLYICAEKILSRDKTSNMNKLAAFENYCRLCQIMTDIGNREYTERFLESMEEMCQKGALEQIQILEERRMKYFLSFGTEEEKNRVYGEYFHNSRDFKKKMDLSITRAMQSKIQLYELTLQKEELQTEQDSLKLQANIDELTGIYNRRYLEQLVREHSKTKNSLVMGIIMIDVDYFKEYNDFYGHIDGDNVLRAVSAVLMEHKKEGIFPCRYGGDEFTCFCSGLTPEEIESYIIAVVAGLLEAAILHEKSPCSNQVTLSIGYSASKFFGEELSVILQRADEALYDSKQKGRNRFSEK